MSTTLSIQLFEKYKREEKQDKEIAKRKRIYEKQLEKRKASMSSIIKRKTMDYQARLILQSEKKLVREIKKKQSKLDNDMRAILWKKEVKKKVKITPVKQKAYKLACLYAKLFRTLSDWTVILYDTLHTVPRKQSQWWHFYPKWSYPHIALHKDNIYPISPQGNRKQWDNIWYEWENSVKYAIGEERYSNLKELAENKWERNKIRDHKYYQDYIDNTIPLVQRECKRLLLEYVDIVKGIL